MAEPYFSLSKTDQAGLITKHAATMKMRPFIVEKDIWVCWALNKLFAMPGHLQMAFKGGTSLSKVFNLIDRFSEDIDITIDYREFVKEITGKESRSELTKISDILKAELPKYANEKIKPYFESLLAKEFEGKEWKIELEASGEKLFIHYPAAIEDSGYMGSSILIEFGARNVTEPRDTHTVKAHIAEYAKDISFPEATVTVLALMRTYWEKATLAHVEYHRTDQKKSAERWSRHWFDLYKLSTDLDQICTKESLEILNQVVKHKKKFYHYSFANYDDCNAGGLRLVPKEALQKLLQEDFAEMVKSGMFYKDPPEFMEILERLQKVEDAVNQAHKQKHKESGVRSPGV